jgi:cytochrome c oxidase subunit II
MKFLSKIALMIYPGALLAGSHGGNVSPYLPPEDITENGHLIDYLFNYTTTLNIIFFALVCIGLFGFSFLYYYKRHPKPEYTYGTKKSQIWIATIIGALVFFVIDLNITRMANNDLVNVFMNWPDKNEDVVKVEVMAQQWMWNFRYAGKDGVFNTGDDVLTTNDLRVPTGKKVVLQLVSKDVIHSFFVANTRRKVDAIPGRLTRLWFKLTKTGKFDIACAEMCGTYHYRMKALMTVYSPEEYNKWINDANSMALAENDPEVADNYWGWKWQ